MYIITVNVPIVYIKHRIPALMVLAGEKELVMYKITGVNSNGEFAVLGFVETEVEAKKVCAYLTARSMLNTTCVDYEYDKVDNLALTIDIPDFIYVDAVFYYNPKDSLPYVEVYESFQRNLSFEKDENRSEIRVNGLKVQLNKFRKFKRVEDEVYRAIYNHYKKGIAAEQ